MAGVGRNLSLAALLAALLAVGAVVLPSAMWACALAALLGLAGVVLFRGNRWRTSALVVAALALSLAVLDAFAGLLSLTPINYGLVRTTVPRYWPPPDPILGFRPQPNSEVLNIATFGPETLYRRTYHFDADAARVTPQGPAGADTYLFLGDSFIFGQGLPDDETLAAQVVKANGLKVRAVNLGVPGNAPNHLVRAFEAGLLDRYTSQSVKAVVTWIIPAQLARVTGDGSWLGSSPRYVLENGKLRHTGSFNEYRLLHPIAGAKYLLGEQFAFIDAIKTEYLGYLDALLPKMAPGGMITVDNVLWSGRIAALQTCLTLGTMTGFVVAGVVTVLPMDVGLLLAAVGAALAAFVGLVTTRTPPSPRRTRHRSVESVTRSRCPG